MVCSFGILPTMEKLYHQGVMRTKCPDCQFVCITQTDYYRILHQGEENIKKHEDQNGKVVLVTEQRTLNTAEGIVKGYVVIRGTEEKLITHLIEGNSNVDPTYTEDFLLTFRTFIKNPSQITDQLMEWFQNQELKGRVARIISMWVTDHFTDFETDSKMMNFLETFEEHLDEENMTSFLSILNMAFHHKAKDRCITLTRSDRSELLNFQIIGGFERSCGIFISEVEKGSKAEEIGLKRGDQILSVNNISFLHITHAKAMETLCSSTHLSITVKANLSALKEIQKVPDNVPVTKNRPKTGSTMSRAPPIHSLSLHPHANKPKSTSHIFHTLGPLKKNIRAWKKIISKTNTHSDTGDDGSISSGEQPDFQSPYSQSQPDLVSIPYEEQNVDYPEYVLKVYKSDQVFKYLLVHKETTAHEVVMLALKEFGISDPSSNFFSLCEVSVTEEGSIKQKRLQDQMQNLADRQELCSRYYLKTNGVTETLVTNEIAQEMLRESVVSFLQLNAAEIALQLTVQDYSVFRQIEPTEYIDDLFELKSTYGTPALSNFAQLVNKEMFWIVTEICSETNLVKRSKIIKQFIKLARHCKDYRNFNSLFAIISGLGHAAVNRLRQTWEKIPTKYTKIFADLQELMDPSRNMSKYRQLIASVQNTPPMIPFYPVVKKDFTFIHLGNDSNVDGLINFEKLRMIAKEVRKLSDMRSVASYEMLTSDQATYIPGSGTTINSLSHGIFTVKRRKKYSGALNQKKMFEEAQMVRRVKAYLAKMKVITDEEKLHELSAMCESNVVSGGNSSVMTVQHRKCNPSPTLSTASSTSSTSEGRRPAVPKFGAASPQTERKLLSLSEHSKTRPHQSRHVLPMHGRIGMRPPTMLSSSHERSYSDTTGAHHFHPPAPVSVDLSAESSSVTSLSNFMYRKNLNSGNSSESNSSVHLDSHSNPSSRTSYMSDSGTQIQSEVPPKFHFPGMAPGPPVYHHGRSYSHEGVSATYRDAPPDDDDDGTQISAV